MTSLRQSSFARGEITSDLFGRIDQALYSIAVDTARNMVPGRFGGIWNRAGTKFVGNVKDDTKRVRLIPFIFNSTQSYILEFGNLYIRFIRDGAYITETPQTITAITKASPGVLTYSGADPSNGDEFVLTVAGMTELNGRNVLVASVNTVANTYQLADNRTGSLIDTSTFTTFTSGTMARVYTVTTTYAEADLQALNYAQSADVLSIVHPSYPPRDVTRTSDASWTITTTVFGPNNIGVAGTGGITNVTGTRGAAGANSYRYRISVLHPTTGEESTADGYVNAGSYQFGTEAYNTITNITQANPAVVTYVGADPNNGDEVILSAVGGMTQVNNLRFVIANVNAGANTLELLGINSTGYGAYTAGGYISRTYARIDAAAAPTEAAPNLLSWVNIYAGNVQYNVYREYGGTYGLIGTAFYSTSITGGPVTMTFRDIGIPPDTFQTPVTVTPIFNAADSYPSVVCYYQQRRCYANTNTAVATIWMSQPGYFTNFTTRFPSKAGDSLSFTLASTEVNSIKGMVDLGKLIIFTTAGEWVAHGNTAGAISAVEAPNVRQASYNGSSAVRPLIVNANALYIQAQSSTVRDLIFDIQADNYGGKECSIYASHLIEGHTITDWAYQKVPNSVVWAVRSDGTLLSLTYLREQEVLAWAHHDLLGGCTEDEPITSFATVENVCAIPEGGETALYLVVKRDLGGVGISGSMRYVERMATRVITLPEDMKFLDSHLTYDGRNSGATTMWFTGGTNYTYDEHLTLNASVATFTSSDVGKAFYVTEMPTSGAADEPLIKVRLVVDAYTSTTQVQGYTDITVPTTLRAAGTHSTTWARAVKTVSGLWHLAGQCVSILADAYVIGSPLNNIGANHQYPLYSVGSSGATNGVLTLDSWYAVIQVGMPYVSDLETLDVDTTQSETTMGKKMIVNSVTVLAKETRGVFSGAKVPAEDSLGYVDIDQTGLEKAKLRDDETYEEAVDLVTGKFTIPIEAEWSSTGHVLIRQVDPLPITVLALGLNGKFPFKQLGS